MKHYTLVIFIFLLNASTLLAQSFPEQAILKKLKASKIEMDAGNGDGVFKAKSLATQKWGMYQWMFEGTSLKEMIPMTYDSLKYFPFNGEFTAVYNNGMIGIYLCDWILGEDAKQTVECKYDDYQRVNVSVRKARYTTEKIYLALKKEGKWGWVNWMTGEEKSEFIFDALDDLPYPKYEQ